MCCFSGVVEWVAQTKIFARPSQTEYQFLAYSMQFKAKDELAMILPLPVPKKSAENAVRFVSFKNYPDFFRDMAKGFPQTQTKAAMGAFGGRPAAAVAPLEVHDVGSFEASFVPSISDFDRLDRRFRLPEGTWDKLPAYVDFGFAVFKLKPGNQIAHPMAFQFPRANPRQVFFPTVHIHDGEVHAAATFDHDLYLQFAAADWSAPREWAESAQPAGMFLQLKKVPGLVEPDLHCYRLQLRGQRENKDFLV